MSNLIIFLVFYVALRLANDFLLPDQFLLLGGLFSFFVAIGLAFLIYKK